jgi:hypothetical protein
MIVIRRMVDRRRAYTAIFLKGEPPRIFPTSDAEHACILQVYKQDRLHEGILNDFSDDSYGPTVSAVVKTATSPDDARDGRRKAKGKSGKIMANKTLGKATEKERPTKGFAGPLWLVVASNTSVAQEAKPGGKSSRRPAVRRK